MVNPYTNLSATLTLTQGYVEKDDNLNDGDDKLADTNYLSGSLIDTGMFDFYVRDERYLPFEGAGAISDWKA